MLLEARTKRYGKGLKFNRGLVEFARSASAKTFRSSSRKQVESIGEERRGARKKQRVRPKYSAVATGGKYTICPIAHQKPER